MGDDFAVQQLPGRRTGRHIYWLAHSSWKRLVFYGFGLYAGVIVLVSFAEAIALRLGHPLVIYGDGSPASLSDIPYFNLTTMLTISYMDLAPTGLGRLLSVMAALSGVALFGLLVAVVTAKLLSPPQDAVVFSRFAYYCTDPEMFLIIYLNTTESLLVHVEMSAYFKLGGDWVVEPPICAPFVTKSVQTFYACRVPLERIVKQLVPGDALRCSLGGSLGDTTFSVAIQYRTDEIIVLQDRNALTSYPGFQNVDLASSELAEMFHYRPEGALTLEEYVSQLPQAPPDALAAEPSD